MNYEGLSYGPDELAAIMRRTYDELIGVATSPEFLSIMEEIDGVPATDRPQFVASELLDEDARLRRGLVLPAGVLLQRSAFGDRRPTLFCLKKFLPDEYRQAWENVNLTFDNKFDDASVPRTPEVSWRWPLPVDQQAELMAAGVDLQRA